MKKQIIFLTTLLISTYSSLAMEPQRPSDKGWVERAGKATARVSRFVSDEWWNGSHVPNILRECQQERFDRVETEKDGRLNVGNFESALIELLEKKNTDGIIFVLEKATKMKSFKASPHTTILQEINYERLQAANTHLTSKINGITDTTVADINAMIADRARQLEKIQRVQTQIGTRFATTGISGNSNQQATQLILAKLQEMTLSKTSQTATLAAYSALPASANSSTSALPSPEDATSSDSSSPASSSSGSPSRNNY